MPTDLDVELEYWTKMAMAKRQQEWKKEQEERERLAETEEAKAGSTWLSQERGVDVPSKYAPSLIKQFAKPPASTAPTRADTLMGKILGVTPEVAKDATAEIKNRLYETAHPTKEKEKEPKRPTDTQRYINIADRLSKGLPVNDGEKEWYKQKKKTAGFQEMLMKMFLGEAGFEEPEETPISTKKKTAKEIAEEEQRKRLLKKK